MFTPSVSSKEYCEHLIQANRLLFIVYSDEHNIIESISKKCLYEITRHFQLMQLSVKLKVSYYLSPHFCSVRGECNWLLKFYLAISLFCEFKRTRRYNCIKLYFYCKYFSTNKSNIVANMSQDNLTAILYGIEDLRLVSV